MLHIGGGWGDSPFVKRFKYPENRYINAITHYYYFLYYYCMQVK